MINQTRNRNESERIASRREGRKKYHGKNQVRPPVGCREKNSRSGVGGGGRGWVVAVDAGGGRLGGRRVREPAPGRRARGAAAPAATLPAAPSLVARRSRTVRRIFRAAAAPTVPTPARAARPNTRVSASLYMSKVLNSVLPIATATVLPQPIHELDPTCTTFRVSSLFATSVHRSESAAGVSVP